MREIIAQAKAKFPVVWGILINDTYFIVRALARDEYQYVMDLSDSEEAFHENLCRAAVIYPVIEDYYQAPAGFVDILAPFIIDEPGYGSKVKNKAALQSYRDKMNDFMVQAETIIMLAFPFLELSRIKAFSTDELWDYLARAEWVLQKQNVPIAIDFGEDEEEPLKDQAMKLFAQGVDPMSTLDIKRFKWDWNYVEYPFIVGLNWENEELMNALSGVLPAAHEPEHDSSEAPIEPW